MPVMLQVRNVPESIHRTLKARAAHTGVSLSDYCLSELRRCVETPTIEEFEERIRQRGYRLDDVGAAEMVRETRDSR